MDLSALIFVALAVAWAAYLVPKALKHHDEVQRSRTIERFSHTMRVLARREPVDRRSARLVVTQQRSASSAAAEGSATAEADTPAAPEVATVAVPPHVRRRAAAVAARRRRRVLGIIVLATLVVVGLAIGGVVAWPWVGVPVAVLAGWLLACRLSVRAERARAVAAAPVAAAPAEATPVEAANQVEPDSATETTDETAAVDAEVAPAPPEAVPAEPGMWDPVPVTLPTYVDQPAAARRTVQTIDLDSTGVWSSGRSEYDSALARDAEEAERLSRERARARRVAGA